MKDILFKIVTPEKVVYSERVSQVSLPTKEGEITVLPDHESLIGIIVPGEICVKHNHEGEYHFLAVSTGFVEIDQNEVKVFADTAERPEELDEAAVLKAKAEAERILRDKAFASEIAFADAESHLRRELARLRVLRRHQKRGEG